MYRTSVRGGGCVAAIYDMRHDEGQVQEDQVAYTRHLAHDAIATMMFGLTC